MIRDMSSFSLLVTFYGAATLFRAIAYLGVLRFWSFWYTSSIVFADTANSFELIIVFTPD